MKWGIKFLQPTISRLPQLPCRMMESKHTPEVFLNWGDRVENSGSPKNLECVGQSPSLFSSAQLSARRFATEDFQNSSRSMFTTKHIESIANYEFSVCFILLPGLCPLDPFSQFISNKQTKKEMPNFGKFSHFSFATRGLQFR